jgi:anaerobic magnesium-protoporphyrin IX monomethyl ester cyclase
MKVLLLSMPDYFEHMPPVAVRMPNGALTSLAGNIDPHHRVAVADLTELVHELDPDIVGLSMMTFQRRTAGRIINLVRSLKPTAKIVVGGYDPSLAPEAYAEMNVDYIVRGEGEITFRQLLRALEHGTSLELVSGFSYRNGNHWIHNPIARHTDSKTAKFGCPIAVSACSEATPRWVGRWT